MGWLVLFFLIVVAIAAVFLNPTTSVILNLRSGKIKRVKQLNAHKDMVVYEVYFQDGKSRVIDVKFGSVIYEKLKPYLIE